MRAADNTGRLAQLVSQLESGEIIVDTRGDEALFAVPRPPIPDADPIRVLSIRRVGDDASSGAPLPDDTVQDARFVGSDGLIWIDREGRLVHRAGPTAEAVVIDERVVGPLAVDRSDAVVAYTRGLAPDVEVVSRNLSTGDVRTFGEPFLPHWSAAPLDAGVFYASGGESGARLVFSMAGTGTDRVHPAGQEGVPIPTGPGAVEPLGGDVVYQSPDGVHRVARSGQVVWTIPDATDPHVAPSGDEVWLRIDGDYAALDADSGARR